MVIGNLCSSLVILVGRLTKNTILKCLLVAKPSNSQLFSTHQDPCEHYINLATWTGQQQWPNMSMCYTLSKLNIVIDQCTLLESSMWWMWHGQCWLLLVYCNFIDAFIICCILYRSYNHILYSTVHTVWHLEMFCLIKVLLKL